MPDRASSRVEVTNLRIGGMDLADQPALHRAHRRSCSRGSPYASPSPSHRAALELSPSVRGDLWPEGSAGGPTSGWVSVDGLESGVAPRAVAGPRSTEASMPGSEDRFPGQLADVGPRNSPLSASACGYLSTTWTEGQLFSSLASRILRTSCSCPSASARSTSINWGSKPLEETSVTASLRVVTGPAMAAWSSLIEPSKAAEVEGMRGMSTGLSYESDLVNQS